MSQTPPIFDALWQSYVEVTPSAPLIQQKLEDRGESVVNDHVALRTYDLAPMNLDALAAHFTALGYTETGQYTFEVKKLRARSFSLPGAPRVFISELRTALISQWARDFVTRLTAQIDGPIEAHHLSAGPLWAPIAHKDYERLLEESEYAAWVAAFGLRANHFTVSVGDLTTFGDDPLVALGGWVKEQGFALNASGGEIKGSPAVMLEQSSTLADRVEIAFAGGQTHRIPSCYCEFALRHTDPATGKPFDGFVTQSADKIFESTDTTVTSR